MTETLSVAVKNQMVEVSVFVLPSAPLTIEADLVKSEDETTR